MSSFEERLQRYRRPELVNLLVVDDQPKMREMIRSMLKSNGYKRLQVVENGRLAVQSLFEDMDVVITDWNMPYMTGVELLKHVKTDPELISTAVLMVSDESSVDKVLYALEEGVDGYIVKPFSEKELVKNLRTVIYRLAHPDDLQEQIDEMRRLRYSGKYREALELGYQLLKLRNHPTVVLMTCECLYHVKEYEQAIDMLLDSDEETRTSKQMNLLGKVYMDLGKQQEAILYFEQAVAKNPLGHDRKIDLARAYFGVGRITDAEKAIESIMSSDPTDLNLVDIAQIFLDRGEIDRAGTFLAKTVDPLPGTVHVFNNYAIALRKMGRFEESAAIYTKCVKIAPEIDILHYNLGFLYHKIGNSKAARKALENALKVNPQNDYAKKLLEQIPTGLD